MVKYFVVFVSFVVEIFDEIADVIKRIMWRKLLRQQW